MNVVIYSDFDGVFNISKTSKTRTTAVSTKDTPFLKPQTFIHWNPYVVVKMKEILKSDNYDFIWHTTWNHGENSPLASESIGFFGLNKFSLPNLNEKSN